MLVIENGTVYTHSRVIPDGVLLVNGTRIEAMGNRAEVPVPSGALRLDAGGGAIAPGFVNIHIHGIGGHSAADGDVSSLAAMSEMLAAYGVTSWLPTTGSSPLDVIERAEKAVQEAQDVEMPGAEILGIHLEGNFLSPEESGAHRRDLLMDPSPEAYGPLLRHAGVIRIVTLAPELPGALEYTRALVGRGILVSAGHSVALDEEFERAVQAGLSHATHMFCNMGTLRRKNIRRHAGLVESILLDDRVTTEIITDGYHIAPSLMRLAYKVKGPDKLAIVTDGSSLTGMPPGRYSAFGRDVIVEEEITYVADRSAWAGSVATMDHCFRVAVESIGLSLEDALRMASLTPARLVGAAHRKGSLEVGKDADVVILDDGLRVRQTVARGRVFEPAPKS